MILWRNTRTNWLPMVEMAQFFQIGHSTDWPWNICPKRGGYRSWRLGIHDLIAMAWKTENFSGILFPFLSRKCHCRTMEPKADFGKYQYLGRDLIKSLPRLTFWPWVCPLKNWHWKQMFQKQLLVLFWMANLPFIESVKKQKIRSSKLQRSIITNQIQLYGSCQQLR